MTRRTHGNLKYLRTTYNKTCSRSIFQFYAITFGSSFFNMTLGYVKFATAIGFMQNRSIRVFIAYIGIVITNTMEWIYSFIIVMNNLFIYMVAKTISGSESDWLEFNEFVLKHYKVNFSIATLFLPGMFVSTILVARLCYILKTCIDRIGFWRTLSHFKNSTLVFLHSALTNLAIYDKVIAAAEMEENEENIAMRTVATDEVAMTRTRPRQKEKRSLSLPCNGLAPQRVRFSSLPLIFHSSSLPPSWQAPSPRDVAVACPMVSHHLYIAHSSELEKKF